MTEDTSKAAAEAERDGDFEEVGENDSEWEQLGGTGIELIASPASVLEIE
jgi:hypothetical protein